MNAHAAAVCMEDREGLLQAILESVGMGLVVVDKDGRFLMWNDAASAIVGMGMSERPLVEWPALYGAFKVDGVTPFSPDELTIARALRGEGVDDHEVVLRNAANPDGTRVSVTARPVRDAAGSIVAAVAVFHDVTEKARREEQMRRDLEALELERTSELQKETERRGALEAAYRQLFQVSPFPLWVFDVETLAFLAVNDAAVALYGYSREEFLAMTIRQIRPEEDQAVLEADLRQTAPGYKPPRIWRHRKKDGSLIHVEVSRSDVTFEGRPARVALVNDVTERRRLEEQLLHAQKMDAIGRLAGGVAHDFNNLLMGILSFATFARQGLPQDHGVLPDLDEVLAAAGRATELTRQLLAFSRQQVAEPTVLNINDLVRGLDRMLRRTLGEHIELVTLPHATLGMTRIDPGHFEQVLVNLAINARDAMPGGGKLIIETGNVTLDESYLSLHPGAREGDHVMLAVSDTGVGMPPEVRARIFEPFFTTKPLGHGTGLGLATCYGIVKQAGGNIWVYSEPGRGTTFKIYLPRSDEPPDEVDRTQRAATPPGLGTETILVTEDDPAVRASVARTLLQLGYRVLEAQHAEQALQLAMGHQGPIHLLLTDVVMPQMGGPQLASRLKVWHPELKVLYMSGYTDDAIVHHGELDRGVAFLQKPFMPDVLGRKTREILDAA